jgi:heme-degrading monooxygenase HmoA
MHARVTQFRILPGKLEEFTQAIHSVVPAVRKQKGFRALLVLRADSGAAPEGQTIAVWDSLEDLRASEKNFFFYSALAKVMACCEGFPAIAEQEVLVSQFAPEAPARKDS